MTRLLDGVKYACVSFVLCQSALAHGWDEVSLLPPEDVPALIATLQAVADLWDTLPPDERGTADPGANPLEQLGLSLALLQRDHAQALQELPVDEMFTNPVTGRLSPYALVEHTQSVLLYFEEEQEHGSVPEDEATALRAALHRFGPVE